MVLPEHKGIAALKASKCKTKFTIEEQSLYMNGFTASPLWDLGSGIEGSASFSNIPKRFLPLTVYISPSGLLAFPPQNLAAKTGQQEGGIN